MRLINKVRLKTSLYGILNIYSVYIPGSWRAIDLRFHFIIIYMYHYFVGKIQFAKEPKTTFVQVGERAFFDCNFTGSNEAAPVWIINHTHPQASTRLSSPYKYNTRTRQLIINSVNMSMNYISIQCALNSLRSTTGYLIVCDGRLCTKWTLN